jgi:hypothetical protein
VLRAGASIFTSTTRGSFVIARIILSVVAVLSPE